MALTLVIGSKRWSSWSLRPWIALKEAHIPFKEILIPLRQPDTRALILEYSPAGRVPILIDRHDMVWESAAILDYLAVRHPEARLWPHDLPAIACARSIAAEMHAGFADLRRELPMDVPSILPTPPLSPQARADVDRVQAIWCDARTRFGSSGPFLFGRFSNADAMFAPVATRFRTYQLELDPICRSYMQTMLTLPSMIDWYRAAANEADEADDQG
jgi:glutathione S-transferase